MSVRIPYNDQLYVSREKAEQAIEKWLIDNSRLLIISSSPATGKSWLLNRTKVAIQSRPNCRVFWLDVGDFLDTSAKAPLGSREIDSHKLVQLLNLLLQNAQETCEGVPLYDIGVETAVLLEKFANAINQCYPHEKIYFLVEGGDEPSENAWVQVERQILEPIARIKNWYFIVVLRQQQRLHSYMLRRNAIELNLGTLPQTPNPRISDKGKQQIANLCALEESEDFPHLDNILATLPHYTWCHPGLNHFVFLEIKKNYQQANWLTDHYRLRGLSAITGHTEDYVNDTYNTLERIVNELESEWTPDALRECLNLSTTATWAAIEAMQTAWLVEHIERNRFKITDGVREFLQ